MEHNKYRYFETRDGRCLPFDQFGQQGEFCIVLEDSCTGIIELGGNCRYFVPDLLDENDISSSSDSWRSGQSNPENFQNEGEVERQAKDILDLAKIFRMETFQILGESEVVEWLMSNHPEKVKITNVPRNRSRSEEGEVVLSR